MKHVITPSRPFQAMIIAPAIALASAWAGLPSDTAADPGAQGTARNVAVSEPATVAELAERNSVLPGQLTAYDTGGLDILALRELSQQRLGERFDMRTLHDRILENGTVPLVMLRAHVEAWLDGQQAAGAR